MSTIELEPIVKHALKLLHSTSPDSAEKIRQSLDEILKQRHGSNKMLINTINKKYIAEEINVPGTIKRQKSSDSRSSISASGKNNSPISSHQEISLPTSSGSVTTAESSLGVIPIEISSDSKNIDIAEEENLKEFQDFGDLACVVCGAMVFAAGNRLVECADCHSLFHQECHKPPITDDDANEQEFSWCCSNCKNKAVVSKTSLSATSSSTTTSVTPNIINSFSVPSPSPSKSSSSSTSSSPHYKNFQENSSGNNNSSSNNNTSNNNPPSTNTNKSSKSTSSSSSNNSNSNNSSTAKNNNGNNSNSSPGATKAITGNSSTSSPTSIASSSGSNSSKGNSSGSGVSTPRINIITVDKRLQIMKKKAAKQNESKRKK